MLYFLLFNLIYKVINYSSGQDQIMEFINVTQFYEVVLCFSIPFLLIQRMILYCAGISNKYEQFRKKYYEAEFQFTHEYQFVQNPPQGEQKDQQAENKEQPPPQQSIRDSMLDKNKDQSPKRESRYSSASKAGHKNEKEEQIRNSIEGEQKITRKSYANMDLQSDKEFKVNTRVSQRQKSVSSVKNEQKQDQSPKGGEEKEEQQKPKSQEDVKYPELQDKEDEADRVSKKSMSVASETSNKDKSQKHKSISSEQDKQEAKEQVQSRKSSVSSKKSLPRQPSEITDVKIKKQEELPENSETQQRAAEVQQEDRRETQLDRQNLAIEKPNDEEQLPRQQIQINPEVLEQQQITQRRRLKYCRRIDQAFNIYAPMIFSVVILGILTRSVYIFSMCCFFGYVFASLLLNFGQLLEKLEDETMKQSLFGKVSKLLSSIFILSLFISYWISDQFSA